MAKTFPASFDSFNKKISDKDEYIVQIETALNQEEERQCRKFDLKSSEETEKKTELEVKLTEQKRKMKDQMPRGRDSSSN